MKKLLSVAIMALLLLPARADEGMWLLPLLEKMNAGAIAGAGCRLTPEQIYSINHSSLKDAIVHFGGGCTGEMISDEGLLVTNHHCGYSSIQGLSTTEHNYLMDGYWAMTRDKELPCPGLTVTFMQQMTDVTDRIEKAVKKGADFREFAKTITDEAEKQWPGCRAVVYPFYSDNVYYLIVYKTYRDVRFVGAPPASVGKFGGETDNWMWPRHTGDFSMFRVYAGEDNEPADYSPSNKPYVPAQHLKVSLRGVREGDYAMIMGYPGRTQRFQTAAQLEQMIKINRIRIDARTVRQDIMWEEMCKDPAVQLKYANKYAGSANGWKKWQGEELAFKNLNIIGRETEKEEAFLKWASKNKKRDEAYSKSIGKIAEGVAQNADGEAALALLTEAPYRIELAQFAAAYQLILQSQSNPAAAAQNANGFQDYLKQAYRDYVEPLDRREAVALLKFYRDNAKPENNLTNLGFGSGNLADIDIPAYVEWLFNGSAFTSIDKLTAAINESNIDEDPAVLLYKSIIEKAQALRPGASRGDDQIDEGQKEFTAGLMEWKKKEPLYPDANSTMRLTYGNVLPYSPKDAVLYNYYTTLEGVMEKENPDDPEFIVPAGLKTIFENKDYGQYADQSDGKVHVCFLTNNDITGGNSGSPVLDADGCLIGLAFDGNWESMSSDVMFEPFLQRCICVDIRYVLLLVERLGGAKHIIDELDIVK